MRAGPALACLNQVAALPDHGHVYAAQQHIRLVAACSVLPGCANGRLQAWAHVTGSRRRLGQAAPFVSRAGTTGTGRSSCGLEQEEDTSITREQYGGVHARLEGWDGCEVGAGCVRDRKQAKLHHG